MMQLRFSASLAALLRGAETLVVVAPESCWKARRFPKIEGLDAKARKRLLALASELKGGLGGASAATHDVDDPKAKPARLVACVLPDEVSRHNSPARAEAVRRLVAGAATRDKTAVLAILDDQAHMLGVATAVARALPAYTRKSDKKKPGAVALGFVLAKGARFLKAGKDVQASADYGRHAARLVDTPPTDLSPGPFAREAKKLFRELGAGIRVSEIVGDKLLDKKLGGIHGVGRCALDKPRLLVARYKPKGLKKNAKHVALVGKGITYDTGGLNLKISGSMSGMKTDMGGAAAVLGAFCALVKGGCPHELSLLLCMAENAIGPAAFKPDDVLEMHSGKTVEINNTDAEGRLVLGDGVSWAARVLKATHILDAATLTGAQMVSTGRLHAGIVSNDEKLEALCVEAGRASGDLCHALPFAPEFYKSEFASKIADMLNSVRDRLNAQSSCAGQFIYNHIEDCDVKWCHVDLAGPSKRAGRGSGFGVSLLAELVRRI